MRFVWQLLQYFAFLLTALNYDSFYLTSFAPATKLQIVGDSFVGSLDLGVIVPSPYGPTENFTRVATVTNTTAPFNYTFEPCSAKLQSWVSVTGFRVTV